MGGVCHGLRMGDYVRRLQAERLAEKQAPLGGWPQVPPKPRKVARAEYAERMRRLGE